MKPAFAMAKRLLVIILSLGVSLMLCELVLRIYNPLPFRVKGDRIVLPSYRKYLIKNDKFSKLDPVITHTKNSLGFRGPEPPKDFDKRLTLITVGGSTTECFDLSDPNTWTARLEARLRPCIRDLWVNNAGLDGHSTFGHLVLLRDHVARLRPKVLLFLVGLNDVGHESPARLDSSIERTEQKLGPNARSARAAFVSLANHSEVAGVAVNLHRYLEARERRLIVGKQLDLKSLPHFDGLDASGLREMEALHESTYIPGYERRLRQVVEISRENGIDPIFVTAPALYGEAVDDVTGVDLSTMMVKENVNGRLAWQILQLYNDVTRRVGRETGTPVIELANHMPKNSSYFFDYVHYTNEGADKVAEIINRQLCPILEQRYARYIVRPCSLSERTGSARPTAGHNSDPGL